MGIVATIRSMLAVALALVALAAPAAAQSFPALSGRVGRPREGSERGRGGGTTLAPNS